jgi:hypothetical protein
MTNMISRRTFLKTALLSAVCISAIVFAIAELKSAEPIPSQISDEAFWKLVTTMSEPDGQFRYENFLSNEIQYQYVIPDLKSTTRPGGAYMGVGPEQNFTYIVALRPKIAFITDIRRQNMLELMMYKAIFELCPDRADFLSMLFSRARPEGLTEKATAERLFHEYLFISRDEALYQKNVKAIQNLLVQKHQFDLSLTDLKNIAYVYSVFANDGPYLDYSSGGLGTAPGGGMPNYSELMIADDAHGVQRSYLASEANYKIMRDMEMKNLVVPIVGDFAGPKSIRAIGQYLKDHGATVTAFYLSNVEQYLYSDGKLLDFFKNAATLPMDASSTFIRTFGPNGGGAGFGGGRGFQSTLSSMMDVVKVCTAGRGCDYSTVRQMSR